MAGDLRGFHSNFKDNLQMLLEAQCNYTLKNSSLIIIIIGTMLTFHFLDFSISQKYMTENKYSHGSISGIWSISSKFLVMIFFI